MGSARPICTSSNPEDSLLKSYKIGHLIFSPQDIKSDFSSTLDFGIHVALSRPIGLKIHRAGERIHRSSQEHFTIFPVNCAPAFPTSYSLEKSLAARKLCL